MKDGQYKLLPDRHLREFSLCTRGYFCSFILIMNMGFNSDYCFPFGIDREHPGTSSPTEHFVVNGLSFRRCRSIVADLHGRPMYLILSSAAVGISYLLATAISVEH